MKRIEVIVASIMAGTFVFLGGAISPFLAIAESAENGLNSTDIVTSEEITEEDWNGANLGENGGNNGIIGNTYVCEDERQKLEITVVTDTLVVMGIWLRGNYIGTVNYDYKANGNIISLYSYGTLEGTYLLKTDGTYEKYVEIVPPETSEPPEESVPEESAPEESAPEESAPEEIDFEAILALAGQLMDKAGFKNEWDKALYYIKTAASQKKVDVMLLVQLLFTAVFCGDRCVKIVNWNKKRKTDTTNQDIQDIKDVNEQQTTAINSLIDETEKVSASVEDSKKREKALANALTKQNVAIRGLIRGTNIKQDLKDEAFRALNESDDLCDEAKKEKKEVV